MMTNNKIMCFLFLNIVNLPLINQRQNYKNVGEARGNIFKFNNLNPA